MHHCHQRWRRDTTGTVIGPVNVQRGAMRESPSALCQGPGLGRGALRQGSSRSSRARDRGKAGDAGREHRGQAYINRYWARGSTPLFLL